MKITDVLLLEIAPVSFRIDWLISRACRPTCVVADFAFEFLLRHQGGDRVDDDHVDGVRLDQHLGDLHRLFAAGRLADQERLQLDAQLLGPSRVEGVLGVDEGRDAAGPLGLGDDVQGERRLAARFRAKDLDDAAAGNALPAQGDVERQAAGRDPVDLVRPSAPSGMIAPSPNSFSIWATVFFRSGLPSSMEGGASTSSISTTSIFWPCFVNLD